MELKKLTSSNLIAVDLEMSSKEEVIKHLISLLAKEGKLNSEKDFYDAVMAREALSPTGMEAGFAIPHGKSTAVKEAAFAVARLVKPIEDWESIDENNKVELVILLAIPEAEAGSTHLTLLAELAKKLANPDYTKALKTAPTVEAVYATIDGVEKVVEEARDFSDKYLLAVTACPAGIAHTYMAAEALQRAGEEMGVKVYVEKQGANGIEDPHSEERLKGAEAVIFAADVSVKNDERFGHLPVYRTTVASPLKDAKKVIESALDQADKQEKGEYKASGKPVQGDKLPLGQELKNAVLTGISHIVPIIVAGGMILAFAVLVAQGFGLQELYGTEGSWLWMFRKLGGGMLGTLMVPILSAYMAYSIADKPALGPGFAGGVAANLIKGGFLGGMLAGLIAGYTARFLKEKFPAKGTFAGFISFWVYPVFGSLITGALMLLVFGKPVAALNNGLLNWLNNLSGANAAILGLALGAMVSFDLGGPVNKAAYTFCIGAMANGNFVPYAAFASIKMVSAFSVTAATALFGRYFEEFEREVGKSTWLLGLAGITEGAIPFMIEDPLRVIPSLCIGSAVTGAMVMVANIGLSVPGAGIFSLFVLQGESLAKAGLIWFGAAIVGTIISTALLVITRIHKLKKHENLVTVKEEA